MVSLSSTCKVGAPLHLPGLHRAPLSHCTGHQREGCVPITLEVQEGSLPSSQSLLSPTYGLLMLRVHSGLPIGEGQPRGTKKWEFPG